MWILLTLLSRPPARQTHKRRKCREAVPYLFWQALTSYGEAGPQFCWEGNLKANYNVDCPGGNSEASGRCLFFLDQVRWKFFYSSNSCRKIWPWLRSRQVSMDCIYQMWDWNVTSYILHLVTLATMFRPPSPYRNCQLLPLSYYQSIKRDTFNRQWAS